MITRVVIEQLVAEARTEMLSEAEAGKPFFVYLLGFIAGANLATDGNPHTVTTILEHVIKDFESTCMRRKP